MHRFIIGQSQTGKSSLLSEFISRDNSSTKIIFDTDGTLPVQYDLLFTPTVTRWNLFDEPVDPNLTPHLFSSVVLDVLGRTQSERPLWITNLSVVLSFVASAFVAGKRNLTQVPTFLTDPQFRSEINLADKRTREFWERFDTLKSVEQNNLISVAYSLFACLFLDKRLHRLFDTSETKLSLTDFKDKTVLIQLPVYLYGRENVSLVASLVLAYLSQLTPSCSLYLENVDLFAKGTVIDLLSSSNVSLTLTAQYIDQLHPSVFSAIQGNCGEKFVFRVTEQDAQILKTKMPPMSPKTELEKLANFTYRQFPYRENPDGVTIPLEK